MPKSRDYSFGNFALDALLLFLTGGVWVLGIMVREIMYAASNAANSNH